jgi:hypothetical protein
MTTLPYAYHCNHLTQVEGIEWRQIDYDANKIVKGAKQEPFKGHIRLTIQGVARRFDQGNIEGLIKAVLRHAGEVLREEQGGGPIALVPIPNSGAAVGVAGEFRTDALAQMVAAGYGNGATVVPAIRWDAPREKVHLGGGGYRHHSMFEPHMVVVELPATPIVLFDDVITSGSQMIAAARKLKAAGNAPVRGIALARATKQHEDENFLAARTGLLDLDDDGFNFDDWL